MVGCLEIERLSMAALGLGIARRALEIMNSYASTRRAFGKPIRSFGQIQRHIAESYAQYMAGRSYVYSLAEDMDGDTPGGAAQADGAKLFCASMAKNVADCAIQVLGAPGCSGQYPVERLWRDAKLLEIGGGTLEAHQMNITRQLTRLERLP
jgi:isovaleryl-CoA dehydrogenase